MPKSTGTGKTGVNLMWIAAKKIITTTFVSGGKYEFPPNSHP
jgi:hypothetical protein